jgi:hypothetical protein
MYRHTMMVIADVGVEANGDACNAVSSGNGEGREQWIICLNGVC